MRNHYDELKMLIENGSKKQALLLFYREIFHPLTLTTLLFLWLTFYQLLDGLTGQWIVIFSSCAAASTASPLFRAYIIAIWESVDEKPDIPLILARIISHVQSERAPGFIAAFILLYFTEYISQFPA